MPPTGPAARDAAVVVGVVGACGGVGASTLAAALAVAGVRGGLPAVLVDGRHSGAGIDVLLGVEEAPGLRWADLQDARGEVDPFRLLDLLPRWSGVHVLSTDRARTLLRPDDVEGDVLRAVRAVAGLVVLDLPAGRLADHVHTCDVVVVVARCDTLSVAGAQSVVAGLSPVSPGSGQVPLGLVVRGPTVGRLLAHDVAAAAGVELWGEIVGDPSISTAVEAGAGPPVRLPRERARTPRDRTVPRRRGAGRPSRGVARTSLGAVASDVLAHAQALAVTRPVGR